MHRFIDNMFTVLLKLYSQSIIVHKRRKKRTTFECVCMQLYFYTFVLSNENGVITNSLLSSQCFKVLKHCWSHSPCSTYGEQMTNIYLYRNHRWLWHYYRCPRKFTDHWALYNFSRFCRILLILYRLLHLQVFSRIYFWGQRWQRKKVHFCLWWTTVCPKFGSLSC